MGMAFSNFQSFAEIRVAFSNLQSFVGMPMGLNLGCFLRMCVDDLTVGCFVEMRLETNFAWNLESLVAGFRLGFALAGEQAVGTEIWGRASSVYVQVASRRRTPTRRTRFGPAATASSRLPGNPLRAERFFETRLQSWPLHVERDRLQGRPLCAEGGAFGLHKTPKVVTSYNPFRRPARLPIPTIQWCCLGCYLFRDPPIGACRPETGKEADTLRLRGGQLSPSVKAAMARPCKDPGLRVAASGRNKTASRDCEQATMKREGGLATGVERIGA